MQLYVQKLCIKREQDSLKELSEADMAGFTVSIKEAGWSHLFKCTRQCKVVLKMLQNKIKQACSQGALVGEMDNSLFQVKVDDTVEW